MHRAVMTSGWWYWRCGALMPTKRLNMNAVLYRRAIHLYGNDQRAEGSRHRVSSHLVFGRIHVQAYPYPRRDIRPEVNFQALFGCPAIVMPSPWAFHLPLRVRQRLNRHVVRRPVGPGAYQDVLSTDVRYDNSQFSFVGYFSAVGLVELNVLYLQPFWLLGR